VYVTERHAWRLRRDQGFTTIELLMTCLIMTIVVAMAGTALYSISMAANRNDANVSNEQQASNVMTQMSRDIRSAASISFPNFSTSTPPSNQIELVDNQVSGSSLTMVPVLWTYTTTSLTCTSAGVSAPCLVRDTQVNGSFVPDRNHSISLANKITTDPVFAYYTFSAPDSALSALSTPTEFTLCTTAVGVDLVVSSTTDNAKSTFKLTDQIALANQLSTLTAPGNGECRS
jgi:type II secretory pathway pseudopilin PulG